ncbi:fimbrillin family protein [Bacteroides sp. 519]|uniref:fimbrillin family protein n=1 Tax=Bacteroides sp. 519 TaxID=2302937 RepID=UPI0013D16894|nr:fimbrillin family protein [Bacteroides sp. 519]NDV56642.1 hypothetical protein [Bacteroides sp. 519]
MKKEVCCVLFVAIAAAGCIGEDTSRCNNMGPVEFKLSAKIEADETRTPYNPSENLTARVLASTCAGDYDPTYANGIIAFACNGTSQGSYQELGFTGNRYFANDNNDPVYFVGLYPANNWQTERNVALYTLDGKTDLMAAAQVYKRRTEVQKDAFNCPQLVFKRLLTKLEIRIKAENEKAAETWGEITKIELVGAKGGLYSMASVDLELGTASFGLPVDDYPVYIMSETNGKMIYTNTKFENQSFPVSLTIETPVYKAYTLTAPIVPGTSGYDYTFRIYTTKAKDSFVTVGVNLKDANGNQFKKKTTGKSFVITLEIKN